MKSVFQLKGGFSFAMHGAGAYSGCVHTNSREAFVYWWKNGIKIFEIDVGVDDQYEDGVAFAHELRGVNDWLQKEIHPAVVNPDYKLNRIFPKSTRGLSIMKLSELFQYMKEDPDLLIMLDFWGGHDSLICSRLTQLIVNEVGDECILWDRLLIEVYTREMILVVKRVAPKSNMIFGESDYYKSMTVAEIMSYGILFVSFPRKLAVSNMDKFEEYVKNGFTVFSLSSSNIGCKKWMRLGVNVNIIDIKYSNCFQFIKHITQSMLPKINVVLLYIDYFGLKEVIKRIKNKLFK